MDFVTRLVSLLARLLRLDGAAGARAAEPAKPLSDLAAEAAFDAILRTSRRVRTWGSDAAAAARTVVAVALARSTLLPPVVEASDAARPRPLSLLAARLAAPLESQFASRWSQPGHARVAAGLFTTSFALVCAGLVGTVAIVAPTPAVPIETVANRLAADPGSASPGDSADPAVPTAESEAPSKPEQHAAATRVPLDHAPTTLQSPVETKIVIPQVKGALPVGKGMWIWLPERAEGGDANAIVAKAAEYNLTHIFVRTGSTRMGFYAQGFLDALLPVAHAAGIRVYGWDFPYLHAWGDDVFRSLDAIHYTTPSGDRIDGFAADIETKSEGTNITAHDAGEYGRAVRKYVGPNYPLIAVIPNPTEKRLASDYPWAEVTDPFDAIAPMVYWMNREPGEDVAHAMRFLSQFGKPIMPIGQAYDGGPEGGPPGVPGRGQIIRFMQVASQYGAPSVSFWSWQHATDEVWHAVYDAAEFRLHKGGPDSLNPAMVREYQHLLNSLGFIHAVTGAWDGPTFAAVSAYQNAAHLPMTGIIDQQTFDVLMKPFPPPIQPQAE